MATLTLALNIRGRSARRERGGGNDEIARTLRWDF
jgi:hypothetical protein